MVLVALVGIGAAAEVGSRSLDDARGLDFQYALVDLVGISSLLAIILGITIVTTEFRHGTITRTLLATPGRERVLAGKAIAGVLIAILFAALAILVVLASPRSTPRSTAASSSSPTATSSSVQARSARSPCSGC